MFVSLLDIRETREEKKAARFSEKKKQNWNNFYNVGKIAIIRYYNSSYNGNLVFSVSIRWSQCSSQDPAFDLFNWVKIEIA